MLQSIKDCSIYISLQVNLDLFGHCMYANLIAQLVTSTFFHFKDIESHTVNYYRSCSRLAMTMYFHSRSPPIFEMC